MKKVKFQAYVVKQYLSGANGIGSPGIDEWEEMVEVSGISFVGEEIDYVTDEEGDEYSYVDNSLKAVREYTGLKDKNGVEIYEGDFVTGFYEEYSGYLDETQTIELSSRIEFKNGAFCLRREYLDNEGRLRGPAVSKEWDAENVVVIGNIYENPELLDNKK